MVEVFPNLFVGSQDDYELTVRFLPNWLVVHACKEPYHRQALGYTGRAAAINHPEYLIARRGDHLILNLVDVADPAYIRREIMEAAIAFIEEGLRDGRRVLVHCNKGESRGPSIGLFYLLAKTDALPTAGSFADVEDAFRKLCPQYNPATGMKGFLQANFDAYKRKAAM